MVVTPLSVSASITRWKPSVSVRSASAALVSAGGVAVSNMMSSVLSYRVRRPFADRTGIPYVVYQSKSTPSRSGSERMIATVEGPTPAPTLALQPLNANVSFRDQAYTALKQAIMDADIYARREEIRLDERQLSTALGVSRTPIREA